MTAFDQMVEKFHLTDTNGAAPDEKSGRINLLNWDGKSTSGLLPTAGGSANGAGANGATSNGGNGAAANGTAIPAGNGATPGSPSVTVNGAAQ
jgi:nitrate reductase beta subunit